MQSHPQLDLSEIIKSTFWKTICPDLAITEDQSLESFSDFGESRILDETDWNTCLSTVNEDGYFAYPSWFDPKNILRLKTCFLQLESAGIHPVFAFVFDEFWDLLLQMDPIFSEIWDEYELMPNVWSWLVRNDTQTAFPPHRDMVRHVEIVDEEHLDYLTVWIPLSDLNHLSSCMCLIPASLDPNYESETQNATVEDLQTIRCLQGPAGSVFCWSTQLVHWGTRQSRWGEPRLSVGFFVKNAEAGALDDQSLDLSGKLSLQDRLRIIGRQILDYDRKAEPTTLEFAKRLIEI